MNDWKAERRFELYYYDGLARQDQEIKLSIGWCFNMFYLSSYLVKRFQDLLAYHSALSFIHAINSSVSVTSASDFRTTMQL